MKALSLTRPYGSLAVLGEKGWDTRPRRFHHYGETAIHASKGFPKPLLKLFPGGLEQVCGLYFFKEALQKHGLTIETLPEGAILGVVDIVRYERTEHVRHKLDDKEIAFGYYADGRWAYEMANPRAIEPVACSGSQGLWNVPENIERQVREQLKLAT